MSLVGAIMKKVKSQESVLQKYPSPPPEPVENFTKNKKKRIDKFAHIRAKVDNSPPPYSAEQLPRKMSSWQRHLIQLYMENTALLMAIRRVHLARGKVDCRWEVLPPPTDRYYRKRADFYKYVHTENQALYKRIINTGARVVTAASHAQHWQHVRKHIMRSAREKFVLFPPIPQETIEDSAFLPPTGVKRPRVYISLRIQNGGRMGELAVELFTDVCPLTCRLFLDLIDGDGLGYGYVGSRFFRKVPHLYWSGGDVVYNNGFGCYAQRGRVVPVGAENYHFSHSMPGLLSMRVTKDDEMCGVFNITFKPLPQFDLRNVVFGRVIRPSNLYESICELGSPLSDQPIVEIVSARRRVDRRWVCGRPNTRLRQVEILRTC